MDSQGRGGEAVSFTQGDEANDGMDAANLFSDTAVDPVKQHEDSHTSGSFDMDYVHQEAGPSENSPGLVEESNESFPTTTLGEPTDLDSGNAATDNNSFPTLHEFIAESQDQDSLYEDEGNHLAGSSRSEVDHSGSAPGEDDASRISEIRRNARSDSQGSGLQASPYSSRSRNGSRGTNRSGEDDGHSSIRASNLRSTLDALEGLSFSDDTGEPVPNNSTDQFVPPRRTSSARYSQSQSRSSPTEIIIPRWQPDAEVTFCPICKTQFSFFVRKHHCRKCGRVVCNACSPHRITIPYQYIVQPPNDGIASTIAIPEVVGSSNNRNSSMPIASTGLGGGARVRLCNPCVPDPNVAPPQTPQPSTTLHAQTQGGYQNRIPRSYGNYENAGIRPQPVTSSRPSRNSQVTLEETIRNLYGGGQAIDSSRHPSTHRHSAIDTTRPARSSSRVANSFASMTPTLISQGQIPSGPNTLQPHYRSLVDSSQRPLPPVPRIAEEDECPICHRELPSRTLPDFEKLRENHIQSCIEEQLAANSGPSHRSGTNGSRPHSMGPQEDISQLSSSHPTNPTIYPAASPSYNASNVGRRRGVSNAIPQASSSAATLPGTPESRSAARERAHAAVVLGASRSPQNRGRRSGVFPYKATEKDCIDDAECTICMEEYEVGEEMGRLECFCRYHLRCIQGWFETHPGQCPVHGMDG